MTDVVQTKLITLEDLLAMPEDDPTRYELDDGELIAMAPPSHNHARLSMLLAGMIFMYLQSHKIGSVFGADAGYVLNRNLLSGRDTVRIPDVSFIRSGRRGIDGRKVYDGAPDLAVEIVSPSETYRTIRRKLQHYFQYGVQIVWLVYEDEKMVEVHTRDHAPLTLTETDTLDGADLLPGFALPLTDLFAVLDADE